jgi:hypothetical protein
MLFSGSLAAAPPLAKFGWFAEVVDACWVGVFPDGKTQHSHCYSAQFDQFIRGTATLSGDEQAAAEWRRKAMASAILPVRRQTRGGSQWRTM